MKKYIGKFSDFKKNILFFESLNHNFNIETEKDFSGGAAGHLLHPFDDMDLTFEDFKKIIELSVDGAFSKEHIVTEKLDGQNTFFTVKNGKVLFARNKGHLKNGGEKALDVDGMKEFFKGRGPIYDAFSYAAENIESALKKIPKNKVIDIFGNEGLKYMNIEIIYPETSNVIPYGVSLLVFHGVKVYDNDGNLIEEENDKAHILSNLIKDVNAHIQEKFHISGPKELVIPKFENSESKKQEYFSLLKEIVSKHSLKYTNNISDYMQHCWKEFLEQKIENKDVLEKLISRWCYVNKSIKLSDFKKEVEDSTTLEWILSFDKSEEYVKKNKEFLEPIEMLFLHLGSDVLLNIKTFLAFSPDEVSTGIKKEIESIRKLLDEGGVESEKKIEKLKSQFEKLDKIGIEKLVPSEGIVFRFNNKIYKFTGLFAPVNQILGTFKYG